MKIIEPVFDKPGWPKIKTYYESLPYDVRVLCVHERETFSIIREILHNRKIELFIELGTARGGTTLYFHDLKNDMDVHTFDIHASKECNDLISHLKTKQHRITFHFEDILTYENATLLELLKRPVRKFLYCDNGNKPKEVAMYSKYLSSGDILGTHDWPKEISEKDVAPYVQDFTQLRWKQLEQLGVSTRLWVKN